ncbi:BON1-associated protein 2-like [Senna tora]|uniref:BON1-associated protein 2-like n=1 Tax=Senna tora TaxID=362788 RepID=A0A834W590_9FABA|nr:BON1-associated protein 2-like [Senna tora]
MSILELTVLSIEGLHHYASYPFTALFSPTPPFITLTIDGDKPSHVYTSKAPSWDHAKFRVALDSAFFSEGGNGIVNLSVRLVPSGAPTVVDACQTVIGVPVTAIIKGGAGTRQKKRDSESISLHRIAKIAVEELDSSEL